MQRLDQPEGADVERGMGQAEIVLGRIAQHVAPAPQTLLDRLQRRLEPWIVGREEAQVEQLDQARIEVVATERRRDTLRILAPCRVLDRRADRVRAFLPERPAILKPENLRSVRQPVAGRPAHRRRIGVDVRFGAQLPQASVGLVVRLPRAVADQFEALKVLLAGHPEQPLVEECLHVRQDDLAVRVVLDLLVCLVADAHRAHAAIAGQVAFDPLDQRRLAADSVERLDMATLGRIDDVAQIFEIAF